MSDNWKDLDEHSQGEFIRRLESILLVRSSRRWNGLTAGRRHRVIGALNAIFMIELGIQATIEPRAEEEMDLRIRAMNQVDDFLEWWRRYSSRRTSYSKGLDSSLQFLICRPLVRPVAKALATERKKWKGGWNDVAWQKRAACKVETLLDQIAPVVRLNPVPPRLLARLGIVAPASLAREVVAAAFSLADPTTLKRSTPRRVRKPRT